MNIKIPVVGINHSTKTFLCPHCNVLSLHILQNSDKTVEYEVESKVRRHRIYQCVGCRSQTYLLCEEDVFRQTVLHQFPISNPSIHRSVPDEVKKAMTEAERCLSVKAPNACGTMARRAMSALCQDKEAKGKDLYEQLLDLRTRHIITPDLWEWAEELRVVGRSGAHPEWEDVSPDDAEYAVKFLREIIKYVYVNPSERAEKKLKETKKKKRV